MTSETPIEGVPGASKLRRPHPPQAPQAQELVEAQTDGLASSAASQGSLEDQTEQQQPDGEVELDLDGAVRRMSRRELADTVKQADEARRLKGMAEAVLERSSAVEHVARAYAGMDAAQKQAFEKVLRDPKLLSRIEQQASQVSEMFDDPAPPSDSKLQREVAEMRELMIRHNQVLTGLGQERAQATLAQQVDSHMAQFRVFADAPELSELARENILMAKAAAPDADVQALVMKAAQRQASLLQRHASEQVGRLGPVTNQRTAAGQPKFGAADLKSGKALAYLKKEAGLV